jgi:hypothetical protein
LNRLLTSKIGGTDPGIFFIGFGFDDVLQRQAADPSKQDEQFQESFLGEV